MLVWGTVPTDPQTTQDMAVVVHSEAAAELSSPVELGEVESTLWNAHLEATKRLGEPMKMPEQIRIRGWSWSNPGGIYSVYANESETFSYTEKLSYTDAKNLLLLGEAAASSLQSAAPVTGTTVAEIFLTPGTEKMVRVQVDGIGQGYQYDVGRAMS